MQVWIETRTRFNRTNESSFVSFYFELSFANKKKDNCLFKHLTLNNSHTAKWLIVPWYGQIFQRIFAFKKKTKVGLNKHVAALLKKWGWKNNFCEIEIVSNKFLPQTASFVQKSQPLPKKSFFFLAKKKIKKPLIFASKKKERRVNRSFLGKIATFCWAKKQNKASQKKKSTPINVVSKKKSRANEQNSCSFFTHHNDFVANRIFQHKTKKASKKTSTKKNTKGDENELTRLLSNNKHSFLLRTKIVTSLEERICWVSITQKDVLNLVTPLPQVQFNKIL